MKLRIGIDIDGCLYPWTQAVNEALELKYNLPAIGDHTHWDYLQERITKPQWEWIWSSSAVGAVFGRMDLIFPGAQDAVNQLCRDHEVHFVTHRHPRRTAEVTGRWLNHYFRNYTGVHVVHNRCRKYQLGHWDVFIDDKPQTVLEFCEFTEALVLAPKRPYNGNLIYEPANANFRLFSSWRHIPRTITNHFAKEAAA